MSLCYQEDYSTVDRGRHRLYVLETVHHTQRLTGQSLMKN